MAQGAAQLGKVPTTSQMVQSLGQDCYLNLTSMTTAHEGLLERGWVDFIVAGIVERLCSLKQGTETLGAASHICSLCV